MSGEQFNIDDPKIPLSGRALVQRGGRGSLRGRLVSAPDWDSDPVNESIAGDFGMVS